MEIGRRDGDWWARRLLAKDNLDLSVWKEACPLVKRIIKPYLTSNYIFFLNMLLQNNSLPNVILSLFVVDLCACDGGG